MSDDLIDANDAMQTGEDTFIITSHGHPFAPDGFGSKSAEWRDVAGVRSSVAIQGILKSVGVNMAENQAAPYEIMAALGHSSPKVTKV